MARKIHLSEEDILKDRLAYVGTLAGGLAHEVRSPLNSIHLNVELLERAGCHLEEGESTEKFFKRIRRIKEEVGDLQKILTEFLQFAGPPALQMMAVDLRDFIYDVVEFVDPEMHQAGIKMKVQCEEHPYPVLADRRQMEQVMLNLLFNAKDASKPGDTISVRTFDLAHSVGIEIEDEGTGIDDKVLPRLFEPYFTTKKSGTGLGLGIAKRIIYEHGGIIEVKSPMKNDCGTLFRITLPKEKLLPHEDRAAE
ncbi:MAG: hypothetical protein HQL31_00485 [Planctomycetes bacterium]|nr:hypothetical protein [Planctomycetota bacterium]